MKRGLRYVFMALAFVALYGCHRRPLLDPETHTLLRVTLLTDDINNVTSNIYNSEIERPTITSDMLRVIIYNSAGDAVLSQGFLRNKSLDEQGHEVLSGPLMLSPGAYSILGYNFDIRNTAIGNEHNYDAITAYTPQINSGLYSRFGTRADEMKNIYHSPDHIMVAKAPELTILPHLGEHLIELNAYPIVQTYYLQIRISGQQNMASNANGVAVLSGMASERKLTAEHADEQSSAAVYFELQKSVDRRIEDENQDVLCAVFNTFGKIEDEHSDLQITLSVLTRDGNKHQKVVDMDPVFATEDARERHWLLIDEVWDIPEPIVSGGGGFTPEVDEWEDVVETIPIGPR